jgi:hypothetical protein
MYRNPIEIGAQIFAFRNIYVSMHKISREGEVAHLMSKPEKGIFKQNLAFLVELRERIVCGDVIWSEVAKPVLGPDNLLKQVDARQGFLSVDINWCHINWCRGSRAVGGSDLRMPTAKTTSLQ